MRAKARVIAVEADDRTLEGLAGAAEAALNEYLAQENIRPEDIRAFASTAIGVSQTEYDPGSIREYHSHERGLILTLIHAADRGETR